MEKKRPAVSKDGTCDPDKWVVTLHDDPSSIDAATWDALLSTSASANPFMRHAYFLALQESASAVPKTGWAPQFLAVERGGVLVAACPLYLKSHSYGEYVFDWAWADAYERAGLQYYPKLLAAVPFTPVPGSRLLARDDEARTVLLRAMQALAADNHLSSAHVLFLGEADRAAAEAAGWMLRSTVQFHWHNRHAAEGGEPYADFADFLATLQRDKRKKIQQERRYVREAGVDFEVRQGKEIAPADWDFFYRCYTTTYREHRSTPYLTRDFFARMAATMPEHWLLFTARQAGEPIATSLIALDPEQGHAYGRYWGHAPGSPPVNCLHFEACYYQPLQWCIEHGYRRFEGGAQGEHKMARGLMPVRTHSAHWLSDARFTDAVSRYLAREGAGIEAYVSELDERNPFKQGARARAAGEEPPSA
ncbi:GNAT family N-acetyltransferase [Methylibium sp.]|uniref:GNAT family N-acetyltransferase n=1 Tax=Methylibium sp. TaxID=2067992 RepID=UPI0018395971|nr:GNAT family N-acetyltransferase [Methylibium sp.]MBA3589474.1 N-acetyltransferase [Methylibium sp.]